MITLLNPMDPMVRYGTLFKIQMTEEGGIREKNLLVSKEFDHGEILRRIHDEGIFKSEEVLQRLVALLIEEQYAFDVEISCLDLGKKGRVSEAVQVARRTELNQQLRIIDAAALVLKQATFITGIPEGTLCAMDVSIGPTLGSVKLILRGVEGLERIVTLDLLGPATARFPANLTQSLEHHFTRVLQQYYPDEYLALNVMVSRSDLAQAEDNLIQLEVRCG